MRKWLKKGKPLFAALLVMSILIQNISVFASETSEEQPVVYVNGTNGKDTADGSIYRPVKTLAEAYKRLADTGGIITISGEITNEDKMSISSTELIVNDESHKINNGKKIKITRKTNQYMITNRNELTISDITIDGASDAKSYMIKNAAGTLTINDGAILTNAQKGCIGNFADLVMNGGEITNNYTNMSWYGAGIHNTETGHVTINGGKISNNTGDIYIYATNVNAVGAGITNFGTLDFNGGTISGNTVNYAGAGIYNGGIMNMSGGSVINNVIIQNDFIDVGESYGAGIANSGTLNISGGTISGNSTDADSDKAQKIYGALYNKASGTATITGGTISENEVANGGGIYNDGNMTIENVSVMQNTAIGSGGGIHNNGELTITGGVVSDNVSETDTGNGIFQNGIMNMRDNAVINTNNDIYVVKPITVPAQLNPATEIYGRLTPSEYIFNRVMVNVEYDSTLGSEVLYDGKNTKKWELTPRESWKLEATDLLLDVDTDNQIVLRQIGKNVIKFVAGEHGSLNGESKFIVDEGSSFYEKVTVPMPQANEDYQFTGWTPQLPEEGTTITEDMLFTAEFDNNKHTVTFVDGLTQETISTTEVEHGGDVTPPDAPSHEGYEFTGWDGNVKNIIEDGIVTAIYKEIPKAQYTITFQDWDGTIITQDVYEEGSTIVIPENPTRESENAKDYTWKFTGWNPKVSETATKDVTYQAQYEKEFVDYNIKFVNWNDEVISEKTDYHYGDTVTPPKNPTRESENVKEYTWKFSGWTPEIEKVTGDAIYKATYEKKYIQYTVRFIDYDDSEIASGIYHYGDTVTPPADPVRDGDSEYTYTFAGWDPTITTVTGNTTYKATYKATPVPKPQYTITFQDWDGEIISQEVYEEGSTIVVPESPNRPADSNFTYAFAGWSPDVSTTAMSDATYMATYTATAIPKEYTITFQDWDGSIIAQDVYEEGSTIVIPADPTRPADDSFTYEFAGWSPNVSTTATADATYMATYTATAIPEPVPDKYTITFVDWNGKIISKEVYEEGSTITVPGNPSRPADSNFTYEFAGWQPSVSTIATADATYTATYKATPIPTPKEYKISFVDWNGKVISEKVYKEGAIIAIPENPSRPADSSFIYEFAGWQPSVSTTATADATYTATYKATPIPPKPVEKFTIKFVAGEHGSLDGQTEFILEKGTPFYYGVTIPKTMADTGYHFVGWTPVLPDTMALVTGNMTFQANFAINAYTITYVDGVNDSIIGKVEVEHGGNVTPPDAPQHEGYEFTGWDGNVKNITEDGVVTATYKAIEKPPVDPEDPEIPLTPLEPATPVEKPEKPETPDEKPETPKTEDPEKPTVETTEEVKTGNNLPLAGMSVILMTSIIGAIFITKKLKKD